MTINVYLLIIETAWFIDGSFVVFIAIKMIFLNCSNQLR